MAALNHHNPHDPNYTSMEIKDDPNPNYTTTIDIKEEPFFERFGNTEYIDKPPHGLTTIHFLDVCDDIIAELDAENITDGSTLSWYKLSKEAQTYSDCPGFPFMGTLYLSPRQKQHLAIKSQATLNAAVRDFRESGVGERVAVFTTTPVSGAARGSMMGDGGF